MNGNLLYGKKWAVCGDSFTNGDFTGAPDGEPQFADGPFAGKRRTYANLIASRNGMTVQQLAVGGMTMATPSDADFTNTFSGGLYRTIDADADYITLYFGINDSHHRPRSTGDDGEVKRGTITLGTIDDTRIDTFYGAWNTVMAYLVAHHPFAHIGILVSNGCETDDYRLAEIAIAQKYGVPYLDLNGDARTPAMGRSTNPAIDKTVRDARTRAFAVNPPKNTHPNAAAHAFESVFIENWLRSI
ncbi:MAG: SGNH/GDSL hydrolase family protein [Clostridia bacterium]|nr:SGNH/GDSL hydrolase family protein [Clostridia bacterium]